MTAERIWVQSLEIQVTAASLEAEVKLWWTGDPDGSGWVVKPNLLCKTIVNIHNNTTEVSISTHSWITFWSDVLMRDEVQCDVSLYH